RIISHLLMGARRRRRPIFSIVLSRTTIIIMTAVTVVGFIKEQLPIACSPAIEVTLAAAVDIKARFIIASCRATRLQVLEAAELTNAQITIAHWQIIPADPAAV